MARSDRRIPTASLAGVSTLVVLALVLQTSAPAALASGPSHQPTPRAAQPRYEAVRQVQAERPAPRIDSGLARFARARGPGQDVRGAQVPSHPAHDARAAACRGHGDLPPPASLV